MKQEEAQQDAYWGSAPSLNHHWMAAVLRLVAMSLLNLAELFHVRRSRPTDECDARLAETLELDTSGDLIEKETKQAAQNSSRTTPALMLSSELGRRPRSRRVHPELVEGSKCAGALASTSDKPVATHNSCLDHAHRSATPVAGGGCGGGGGEDDGGGGGGGDSRTNPFPRTRLRICGRLAPI